MTSRKPEPGQSLADLFPEIAAQAVGWDPKEVKAGSHLKVRWSCNLGHAWDAEVKSRVEGRGCPICAGKKVLAGFNDLATTHPELALQALGWDPQTVIAGSNKKLRWRCELGHEWDTSVVHRSVAKTGCPICAGNIVLAGFNDLATTHSELALQALGWDPKEVSAGSHRKLRWKCDLGHEWNAVVKDRALSERECPICSGHTISIGFNDLATTHPELALQALGWDPQTVIAGSNKKLRWRCELGHEWISTVANRTSKRASGCGVCNSKQVLIGFNDLATTHPELALQALGWDPQTVIAGSNKKLRWRCELGHEWISTVAHRALGERGCPICAGKRLLTGFNDLASKNPELALQALGWDPRTVLAGTNRKLRWRCELGHEWSAVVKSRVDGRNCPSCAIYGFDPNKDGWLYFLEHDEWQMFQIGITNFPDARLAQHEGRGWDLLEIRGAMDGSATRALETAILRTLKRRGAVFANQNNGKSFSGWSESWLKSSVKVSGLKELLDFVHEDESK